MCFCCRFLKISNFLNKTSYFCILQQKSVFWTESCDLFEDVDSDLLINIDEFEERS